MFRPIFLTACLLVGLSLAVAQNPLEIEIPEGPKPWTSLDLNNNPERFQFAIVTDRTGGHRPGVFMDAVRKLNLLQPEFVMSVGDLIEGYTEDLDELDRQWDEFEGFVNQLEMPFFYVPGNHDITNAVMEKVWEERFGPKNYYFIYNNVLFMALNSEDQYRGASRGSISDEQYEWIKKTLADHTDVKWTLLFMHQPLWLQNTDPVRWFDVEALLADRKHTVFVGHRHHYVKYERNNNNYFMLATTGGGSSLRGPQLGEFDHVVWVTMTEEGPLLANLLLEGIWDEDVVTEDKQAMIDKLRDINPVRIEPLYVSDGMTEGTVNIRLTNDADIPLTVHLDNGFSWDLTSTLSADTVRIPPNSVEFATLDIALRKADQKDMNWAEMDPVELHAAVQVAAPDGSKMSMPYTYKILPEQKYELSKLDRPVRIDGKLEEFAELPYNFSDPKKSRSDMSVQFNVAYTDSDLYFAAHVNDSDLQIDTAEIAWRQDYLALILDASPTAISAMRTGSGWYNQSLIYLLAPNTDDMPGSSFYGDRLPEGTEWACEATEDGYVFEGRIPLDYIKAQQGDNWKTIRLNVGLQDRDAGDSEFPRFSWMPEWRGPENRVGSGMFFKK